MQGEKVRLSALVLGRLRYHFAYLWARLPLSLPGPSDLPVQKQNQSTQTKMKAKGGCVLPLGRVFQYYTDYKSVIVQLCFAIICLNSFYIGIYQSKFTNSLWTIYKPKF